MSLLTSALRSRYLRLPARDRILAACVRREGGQMNSATLRYVLSEYYGVHAGYHSYGSLLVPGMADERTEIGRYVSIGPNVRRYGAAHPTDRLTMHPYWYNPALGVTPDSDVPRSECVIHHDAWIGANAVILPGCRRIGFGAVVGAGSVVTRDVQDFHIVVGSPARTASLRLTSEMRDALLHENPWQFDPEEASDVLDRLGREFL